LETLSNLGKPVRTLENPFVPWKTSSHLGNYFVPWKPFRTLGNPFAPCQPVRTLESLSHFGKPVLTLEGSPLSGLVTITGKEKGSQMAGYLGRQVLYLFFFSFYILSFLRYFNQKQWP
jgi:hypothetical protein